MDQEQAGMPAGFNMESLPIVKCKCGSGLWDQATQLRRMSAIISKDGKEKLIALPVVVCKECGKELEVDGGVVK